MPPHTAESLLADYLWGHYPPDVRADPTRLELDANPGQNPLLVQPLVDAAALFAANAPKLLGTELSFDAKGVSALSRALDRPMRDKLLADPDGLFVNFMVHASAWLGEVIVRAHHGRWKLRRPLWESVVERRHGGAVSPLHWLLKSLSDDQVGQDALSARFHVHVVLADASPEALAVITTARKLPMLQRPTYDLLVKYLHTHLDALRDLGEAFPSPAEFTALRYQSVGFVPMHEGRVLALYGQTSAESVRPDVVDLHWLTAGGLDHTDSLPCDPAVPCFVRPLDAERLEITLSWQGRPHTHRLGFRGHA